MSKHDRGKSSTNRYHLCQLLTLLDEIHRIKRDIFTHEYECMVETENHVKIDNVFVEMQKELEIQQMTLENIKLLTR